MNEVDKLIKSVREGNDPLSEALTRVETSDYVNAHGKEPKGRGHWMFEIGSEEWEAKGTQNYGQAVLNAKQYARQHGVTVISVMS